MKIIFRLVGVAFAIFTISSSAQNRSFVVAQNFYYKGGVDVFMSGVPYNPIIYESSLIPNRESGELASDEKLKQLFASINPGPFPTVLDIERWSVALPEPEKRQTNIDNLVDVLKRVRKIRPDMKFGYYGEVPVRVYWSNTVPVSSAQRDRWRESNDAALRGLVPHLDALFPSLYNYDEDAPRWEFNTRNILTEARKYGKPVYCYLSPQFHPSNKALAGKYVSRELWRVALNSCHALADGVVIWAYDPKMEWDPQAPWWQETLAFMRANGLPRR